MSMTRERLEAHNQQQIDYFVPDTKRTMLPTATPYVLRQVDELVRFAGIEANQRVLEVGCGMGRYSLPLMERGIEFEGLDLSARLLERLREYSGNHAVKLHSCDVIDCPPAMNDTFDAVVGFFTLHHLHDLKLSFRAMARLLRPGGTIVFLEPNAYNPLYYLQILATPGMTWEGDGGIVKMRRSVIFEAMSEAGLINPALHRFGFFPPFLANTPAGARTERVLEAFPAWRPMLPFQLFRAQRATAR
jgi:SAM-dependent methyltransferase